ncbi:MAG: HAD family phosphatase [Abitibacteriaceae bacterium]|nr:HAD family phosphatase [Abditibacteriaceae bacterium]MBV9865783.1 HAD family phosphatase [Abditibacteriaceae bacterium]
MSLFQALIFDLDGVIIDTESLHAQAKRLAFEKYALDVPELWYQQFRGRSDQDMVESVVAEFGDSALSSAEVLALKHEVFSTLHENIMPVEGAVEFIQQARQHFKQLALTTSATKQNQLFAFAKFGLQPYFDVVVTAEAITHTKPHPEPYLKTVEKLGLPAAACLVIEDSTNGILSAQGAGCAVAAITTSFSREELEAAQADYIVHSFAELASLLGFG